MGFLILGVSVASQLIYFCNGINNFTEYTQAISITGAAVVLFIVFAILAFQMEALFKLIDDIEMLCDGKQ